STMRKSRFFHVRTTLRGTYCRDSLSNAACALRGFVEVPLAGALCGGSLERIKFLTSEYWKPYTAIRGKTQQTQIKVVCLRRCAMTGGRSFREKTLIRKEDAQHCR
ncbi:hypothetical protein DQ04_10541040, partial [Trypanosoma grayi]|uniref:hypothetical protein n=1 Tax=Trypanosoma grayi TaxID=71804 RepID=UPI0004F45C4F